VAIQKNSIKEMEHLAKHHNIAALLSAKDKTAALHSLNKIIHEVDQCLTIVYTQVVKENI